MKILLDLNVLLDVIQRREPLYEVSAEVISFLITQKFCKFTDSGARPRRISRPLL
jgi:hypothetical protein